MAIRKLTRSDYEIWGISELITQIEELTHLLDEAEELLEPYADPVIHNWTERKDSYTQTNVS